MNNTSEINIIDNSVSEYKIIYSTQRGTYGYYAASELSNRIFDATGVRIPLIYDTKKPTEYEIILGETWRRELPEGFDELCKRLDRTVCPIVAKVHDKSITIAAESDFALYENIAAFADSLISHFKDNTLTVSDETCKEIMEDVGKAYDDVSIMSYNVFCAREDERKDRVLKMIEYFSPDLFAAQETSDRWVEILSDALSDYGHIGYTQRLNHCGVYCAIYYKKDRFNLLDSGTIWLSATPDVPGSKYENSRHIRIATWGFFEVKETKKKFFHINTHLQGGDVNKAQLDVIFNLIHEKGFDAYPIFISGDMNMERDAPAYIYLNERFSNCHDIAISNLSKDVSTVNKTAHPDERERIIDHIMTNTDSVLFYKVINENFLGDYCFCGWASDHNAVCVKARLSLASDKE
ncbi:MAG: endonuclease/exonuclease/phosphatase family protein [Clostridia bacterium]|nr:endonuclease/exonuclease/phosphatase family protein [Clostridia bacterium]